MEFFVAALAAHVRLGDRWFAVFDLMGLAETLLLRREPAHAARLLAAAQALGESLGSPVGTVTYAGLLRWAETPLSAERFAAVRAEGRTLDPAAALAAAREIAADLTPVAGAAPPPLPAAGLTRREREVAYLLARGDTDRQIADALFVGVGTVGVHVHNILRKLALRSRHQVAAWLEAQGAGEHDANGCDGAAPRSR